MCRWKLLCVALFNWWKCVECVYRVQHLLEVSEWNRYIWPLLLFLLFYCLTFLSLFLPFFLSLSFFLCALSTFLTFRCLTLEFLRDKRKKSPFPPPSFLCSFSSLLSPSFFLFSLSFFALSLLFSFYVVWLKNVWEDKKEKHFFTLPSSLLFSSFASFYRFFLLTLKF